MREDEAVEITVNGQAREVQEGCTAADIVSSLGLAEARSGVAVAVNGEVLPRSSWNGTNLSEGDRIEVLNAVAGG